MIKLGKGELVSQWDAPTTYQGNYYALDQNSIPTELGINPQKLGFDTDTIFTRFQNPLITTEPVYGLKSYAAPIMDEWSITGTSYMTKGGAPQLFTTDSAAFAPNGMIYYGN